MQQRFQILLSVFLCSLIACNTTPPNRELPIDGDRRQITFSGMAKAGERFQRQFGDQFIVALEPTQYGWVIMIHELGKEEDLARLTPPFHFAPNPREIEGWHFRNVNNTGPNDGTVNAPQLRREFVFSPDVGRGIDSAQRCLQPITEDIDGVAFFGRGMVVIKDLELSPYEEGSRATILKMRFNCTLAWRNRHPNRTLP